MNKNVKKRGIIFFLTLITALTFVFGESFAADNIVKNTEKCEKIKSLKVRSSSKRRGRTKGSIRNPLLPKKGIRIRIGLNKRFRYKLTQVLTNDRAIDKLTQLGGDWSAYYQEKHKRLSPTHTLVFMYFKGKTLSGIGKRVYGIKVKFSGYDVLNPASLRYFKRNRLVNLNPEFAIPIGADNYSMSHLTIGRNGKSFEGYYALYIPKKVKKFYQPHYLPNGGTVWAKYTVKH